MSLPGVSIIICTYNGVESLPTTLDSILSLNQSVPRELILVNNASTEDIEGFCQNYFSKYPSDISFKLLYEKKPGLTHARITGIRNASYEYLLFCDDDNALFPDYLDLGVKIFEQFPTIGVIGGQGIARLKVPEPKWFPKYQHSFAVGAQRASSGIIETQPGHVYGAGSFYRRSPMLAVLDARFYPRLTGRTASSLLSGDDLEWCYLLQLQGFKIYYEDSLKFYHDLSATRLTTAYYIKLKAGTASGSALLFAYRTFFTDKYLSKEGYRTKYRIEALKSWLRYMKNRILKNSKIWEQELAIAILKSRDQSFRTYAADSAELYMELKELYPIK